MQAKEVTKIVDRLKEFSGQHGWYVTEQTVIQFLNQFPPSLRDEAKKLLAHINFLNRVKTGNLLRAAVNSVLTGSDRTVTTYIVPLAGASAQMSLELLKQEFRAELEQERLVVSRSVHEMLGVAHPGDVVIFVDDNIGSGTQFSAQLLKWNGELEKARTQVIKNEKGIELLAFDKNRKDLFSKLTIWLATCVGAPQSQANVIKNLKGVAIDFKGVRFGEQLGFAAGSWKPSADLTKFLRIVGAECIRYSRDLKTTTDKCRADSLGYGNLRGKTVTLWNVPTSTYTALWCPGIVEGEPWCPLFIRRGYVQKLIVA